MARDVMRFFTRPKPVNPVSRFEEAFARYIGRKHAVATCSGTDAMLLILNGLGLKPGDHLLSSAYTIQPLVETFLLKGYDLELVDISREDFNLDVDDLSRKIRPDTKAVIVTHMFGTPARMDEIQDIVRHTAAAVIEDAAHAHGATYRGRRCGALADSAFFSFDQIKPLSTFGGGMALTDDDDLAADMRRRLSRDPELPHRIANVAMGYLEHALVNSPLFWLFGWLTRFPRARELTGAIYRKLDRRPLKRNRRLSDLQAVLGLRQLDHLDARLTARRKVVAEISECLRGLIPQRVPEDCTSTYYKFTALSPVDSASVKEELFRRGIDVGIKDDINYPCYLLLDRSPEEFPGTQYVYEHLLDLPGYESLSPQKIRKIADALAEIR